MTRTRMEVHSVSSYRTDERFYFKGICWALAQDISVIGMWISAQDTAHYKSHANHFREAIKYQTQNFGTNLNSVAFDPINRRWRYE